MTYEVRIKRSVLKALGSLEKRTRRRLWARIRALAKDPRPIGAKPLQEPRKGHYRLRVGDYPTLYTVKHDRLLVLVVRVGERGRVYR